jgi:hypothetical protein
MSHAQSFYASIVLLAFYLLPLSYNYLSFGFVGLFHKKSAAALVQGLGLLNPSALFFTKLDDAIDIDC